MLAVLGLGSRSTLFYIDELNRKYHSKFGGYSTCPFNMLNSNFHAINSLLPKVSKDLNEVCQYYLSELEKFESKDIIIPNITLHEVIDGLVTTKNILHPIALTISKIKANNWSTIVLFGSFYSMQSEYISGQFKAQGIEVVLPSKQDMNFLDDFRKNVYSGCETEDSKQSYHQITDKYTEIAPVVLGCTELSIFKLQNNLVLDMADVQITEAINKISD